MRDRYVKSAKKLVFDKFPEMAGTEPSVSKKRSQSKGKSAGRSGCYVLTFQKRVSLPGGRSLKRLVRVTMDDSGEVVKLTSSK